MKKPPAFQFYVKDWRSSATIRRMTRQEKGDLIEMLAASWDSDEPGSLPLPVQLAANSAGLDPRVVRKMLTKFPKLWVEINGRLVNPKLRAQWEEMQQRQRAQSEAAKKTNEKRWGNPSPGESGSDIAQRSPASASAFASASASASAEKPGKPDPPVYLPKLKELMREKQIELQYNQAEINAGARNPPLYDSDDWRQFKMDCKALGVPWQEIDTAWNAVILPFQKTNK